MGIIGTAIYCEYSRDQGYPFTGEKDVTSIDEKEADRLRENYKATFFPEDTIEGYNISYQQLIAIDSTLKIMKPDQIEKLSGFRLYKGLDIKDDRQSVKSFIVYPIGKDLVMGSPDKVYKATGFDKQYILPCPEFCD